MPELIKEAGDATAVEPNLRGGRRYDVTIIEEGWGSSGYYGGEMLKRDGPMVFPVGTHMYIDHPTEREDAERPERSVRDLAATIVEAPRMAGTKLKAVAEVKEHWAPVIEALSSDIGLSIRAHGLVEHGKAGGREGPIVKTLTEGLSVDFVTVAGAGGKIERLIESARGQAGTEVELEEKRNMANWIESKIHQDFTVRADEMFGSGYLTREERIALSSAIGDALTVFNTSVEENVPGLLGRDPYEEAPGGDAVVEENGGSSRTDKEDQMSDTDKTSELQESVRELTDKVSGLESKLSEAESKMQDEKDRADRAEDALRQRDAARIVGEAIKPVEGLPERAVRRVVESVLRKEIPLDADGKIVESELKDRAVKAAEEELEYLGGKSSGASVSESGSRVGTSDENQGEVTTDDLAEAFRGLGASEAVAKLAAEGR